MKLSKLPGFEVCRPPSSSFDVGADKPDVYGVAFLPGTFEVSTTFGGMAYRQPLTTWNDAVAPLFVRDLQRDFSVDQESIGVTGAPSDFVFDVSGFQYTDHEGSVSPDALALLRRGISDVRMGRVRALDSSEFADSDGD